MHVFGLPRNKSEEHRRLAWLPNGIRQKSFACRIAPKRQGECYQAARQRMDRENQAVRQGTEANRAAARIAGTSYSELAGAGLEARSADVVTDGLEVGG